VYFKKPALRNFCWKGDGNEKSTAEGGKLFSLYLNRTQFALVLFSQFYTPFTR